MGNLNETEKWEENIYQLETSDPVLGGVDGISNRAPRQLANRTKWLKKKTEEATQSLAEHVRSRNHPDATLTAKGFTQLSSATNSTSETLAATPKAVKAAYDLAAGKAPASHTHPWSQITGVPAASLTAKGTVQLSSAADSESETEAATPKAVKIAYDLARGKYTAQDATTTRKGIVQLSSATNSTSEALAATPKAVKAAYDLAAGKAPASHTHPWNQITGVPTASLTAKGTVQLSSATNSTSETLAATPKAVKAAYDLAAGKAPASHTHPWSQITGVPAASLTAKGTVQLSSAADSESETEAATPKAVKIAYDLARGKYTAQDATTTRKGIVQLSSATNSTSEALAATPKAVKAAYDLAAGKAPASHTHPWNQITGVPTASLTAKGTVQLSSATNSTSETRAATPKAVKAAYDLANGKQPADATLTALAGLATAADKLPYFTGNDTASLTTLTNVGRNILAKASTQAVIQYLGLSDASGYVGRWLNTRVFTSSGTYTPTPGTKRIRVTITGGGGGGGGCKATSNNETFFGAGGGAGGTIISIMTPTQNSYPVTIGAGGAGGVSATNGTRGGNSVFASLIAPGGAGGGKVGVTNTNGGNGGVPSTGDIRITGGDGGDGQSGNIGVSGEGGTSYWGGGGRAGAGGGVSGKAYGSGGGGAYDAGYSGTSMTGGKGAAGICIIEEFA
ncbi:tail fiber protein [Escherichia coli]|uniref:tail fiber protein n=2 Tax=Escherichia coli TaxID=562 RepID=UPI00255C0E59|nr:tail fiber protein [Escherichia coli]WIX60360.1 tail fiber protein [Escherichia coli]